MITARLKPARIMRTRKRRSMTARMGRQWIGWVSGGCASVMWRSASLEDRLAFLDEGLCALAHVLGGAAQSEQDRLHRQSLRKVHLHPLVHGLQGEAQGRRAARQEHPRPGFDGGGEAGLGPDAMHQAESVRLPGVDRLSGGDE